MFYIKRKNFIWISARYLENSSDFSFRSLSLEIKSIRKVWNDVENVILFIIVCVCVGVLCFEKTAAHRAKRCGRYV